MSQKSFEIEMYIANRKTCLFLRVQQYKAHRRRRIDPSYLP